MGPELDTQSFARYAIGVEISITILVFILDYFQEKIMTKFYRKSTKTDVEGILGPFFQNLGKNEFSWRKEVSFSIK